MEVYDHDWPTLADGVAIPHGLYDLKRNLGFVQIGICHDTSEFACDSLRHWWLNYGQFQYPNATSVLLLCDGGGSNSSRAYLFKQDLQALADELALEIRIAHYPPYTSKYNPIEHRLFPHLSRACSGVIFDTVERVRQLMDQASTKTGLKVFASILDKAYETGRSVKAEFRQSMPIVFDEDLPMWNYRAIPR